MLSVSASSQALEKKYDAMRDKLLIESLIAEVGEREWNAMTEEQRQRRLMRLRLEERRLRHEGTGVTGRYILCVDDSVITGRYIPCVAHPVITVLKYILCAADPDKTNRYTPRGAEPVLTGRYILCVVEPVIMGRRTLRGAAWVEGKLDELRQLLDSSVADGQQLHDLLAGDKEEQERRLAERLAQRKRRLAEGTATGTR